MISSSQRPLPDNTQHSQQKTIHASSGIGTHDLSTRVAADLRLDRAATGTDKGGQMTHQYFFCQRNSVEYWVEEGGI